MKQLRVVAVKRFLTVDFYAALASVPLLVAALAPSALAGVPARVSVSSDGTPGNGNSYDPAVSADGRFVAFSSDATNLVPGDTNGMTDVFVRDTCTGAPAGCTPSTIRVSVATDGTQANYFSSSPAISADGRFVAFASGASNLVAGDTNGAWDVFLRDTCLGAPEGCAPTTVRVSVASDGTESRQSYDGVSPKISLSADGRFVAFDSDANNLGTGSGALPPVCWGTYRHIFIRDTCLRAPAGCTPSTAWVSVANDGTPLGADSTAGYGGQSSISADGRFVAFDAGYCLYYGYDGYALLFCNSSVYIRDTCFGATADCLPSTVPVEVAGYEYKFGYSPTISADGRFVAFVSTATDLVADDTNGVPDVFLRDTCLGASADCILRTVRVSVANDGTEGNDSSDSSSLSADGRFVAFVSSATNLVSGHGGGVFVRDSCVGASPGCVPGTVWGARGLAPVLSADGRFIAFTDEIACDTNGSHQDVFLAGVGTGTGPSNVPPVASFTSACSGISCAFDGSSSSDPDGSIVRYSWNFGDGTTGAGPTVSHTYSAASAYTVTLMVTDNACAPGTQSKNITVIPGLSSLNLNPSSVTAGNTASGTVTLSAAAPAGGVVVALSSSNPAIATVPTSVTVAAGASSGTFTVSTGACTLGSVTISGVYGGVTQSAGLSVTQAGADAVIVQQADYFGFKRQLRVGAKSTSPTATLRVDVTSTGELIGTLQNLGDGRYTGQFTWPVNPQNITVRSSLCGTATKTVTSK